MPTDTKLNNLIINYLTQQQYDAIQTPNENELYLTPDNSTGGGGGVSPCLNLMDMENGSIRTSITEEEKNNLDKGLYTSVYYCDESWGATADLSMMLPQLLTKVEGTYIATIYTGSASEESGSISGLLVYVIEVGEKNADGTYPITITKTSEVPFAGGGGGVGTGSGVIKSLPFPQTINSEEGYNLLSPIIDAGEIVYAGNAVTDNNLGNFKLILGLSSNVVPTATGDEEYCHFDCIVKDMGIGRMSLKKDANNIPQFKSFTTWLPPVTDNSEGKALIVTGGNAQWTTAPRYEHTITIKNSAGKILWTQTMRNSSNTVVNSYANLKTLFGEATYAGFGEYCQLNLEGGTESTDKLIKADGTEVTLASLGAIVYTDKCFLPK